MKISFFFMTNNNKITIYFLKGNKETRQYDILTSFGSSCAEPLTSYAPNSISILWKTLISGDNDHLQLQLITSVASLIVQDNGFFETRYPKTIDILCQAADSFVRAIHKNRQIRSDDVAMFCNTVKMLNYNYYLRHDS